MLDYAIIVETENLSLADVDDLWRTLSSLETSIARARPPREALLMNSGNIATATAREVDRRHPWISLCYADAGTNYYGVKMQGARRVTTPVVLFTDSDCSYGEDWVSGMLDPFDDPAVSVVAGETGFAGRGPYSLALALVHAFDGYSGEDAPYPVNYYYANNVAFRRQLLLDMPIRTDLPLYRSGCYRHSIDLRRRGETIWAQPRSRAAHSPPQGLAHFFWRFLLFGRDRTVRETLKLDDDAPRVQTQRRGARHHVLRRLGRTLADQPSQWPWLPIALLIAASARLLYHLGRLVARFAPERFIGHFASAEGVRYPTVAEFLESSGAGVTSRP